MIMLHVPHEINFYASAFGYDFHCRKKARKSKRLEKVFSAPIPEEVYDALEKELCTDASR